MTTTNAPAKLTTKAIRSMLDAVLALSKWEHNHGVGCESHMVGGSEIIISYSAPDKTYEVGTPARVLAKGKRSVAVAALETLGA